jgi:hypothetical protein
MPAPPGPACLHNPYSRRCRRTKAKDITQTRHLGIFLSQNGDFCSQNGFMFRLLATSNALSAGDASIAEADQTAALP